MKLPKLLQLRRLIEQAAVSLSDQDASCAAELFPQMKYDESLILYRTRINWKGKVKMAAQDLWDNEQNNPENAPTLWEDLEYRDGIRIIPAVITAAKAFSYGEKGWWGDDLYKSLMPGEKTNVYTPEQYPAGWELV